MVLVRKNRKSVKKTVLNYDKVRKSERRYAAFMFVPVYILIFGLFVFFVGQVEDDLGGYRSYFHTIGVNRNSVTESKMPGNGKPGTVNEPNADGRIELNYASVELLDTLPGIGPRKAEAISETRAEMNGFRTVEDLLNVEGIGEKTFGKLRPYLYISE